MADEKTVYIGLGSNLGDRQKNIRDALKILSDTDGVKVERNSEIIETIPLAGQDQPKYLNTVAEFTTTLTARQLHKKIIDIEIAFGRSRNVKWAPRMMDIDIIFFSDEVINQPSLIVPHPQMHLRTFVLKGICELNSGLEHPAMKVSVSELLSRLNGRDFIPDSNRCQLVCVAGIIGAGKTTLAQKITQLLNCELLLEPYDKNPFLPAVYAGKTELALDSQLFFLTHRVEQLNTGELEKGRIYVTDYIFDKELIYANLQLDKHQLELYLKLYNKLKTEISQPVLVIYLTDTEQNCLERIHKRNRPYEQKIEVSFLQALKNGFDSLFEKWDKSPVIRLESTGLDYRDESIFIQLVNQIKYYIDIKST
jgi:2-amino-4-hydroxy-6-hydroxymethyldihydropteridine diphosphokinase